MAVLTLQSVATIGQSIEQTGNRRMLDWFVAVVMHQVLLADISDVAGFGILSEQVIEGLILTWAEALGDSLIPFLSICEYRVNVEDDAAKVEHAVTHHIPNREAGM